MLLSYAAYAAVTVTPLIVVSMSLMDLQFLEGKFIFLICNIEPLSSWI